MHNATAAVSLFAQLPEEWPSPVDEVTGCPVPEGAIGYLEFRDRLSTRPHRFPNRPCSFRPVPVGRRTFYLLWRTLGKRVVTISVENELTVDRTDCRSTVLPARLISILIGGPINVVTKFPENVCCFHTARCENSLVTDGNNAEQNCTVRLKCS